MAKFTPWFDSVNPVHIGIYQRKSKGGSIVYARWNGENWQFWYYHFDDCNRYKYITSISDCKTSKSMPWRGLAKEPK